MGKIDAVGKASLCSSAFRVRYYSLFNHRIIIHKVPEENEIVGQAESS